jgi:hypothetical protein
VHLAHGVGDPARFSGSTIAHVERGRDLARPDQRRSEGEVGDEMSIHHVDVNPLGAAGLRLGDLLAKPA